MSALADEDVRAAPSGAGTTVPGGAYHGRLARNRHRGPELVPRLPAVAALCRATAPALAATVTRVDIVGLDAPMTENVRVSMRARTPPLRPVSVSTPSRVTAIATPSSTLCASPAHGSSMQRAVRVRVFRAWTKACEMPPL